MRRYKTPKGPIKSFLSYTSVLSSSSHTSLLIPTFGTMKWIITIFLLSILLFSCKKESFITDIDARITISADTLKFDTVFTTTGSITQFFKIRNDNNQKLRLSGIKLMGGASSSYKLNIDGQAATEATSVELAANDSLYVFVKVTIDPNAANLPFIVQDSIKVDFNGNTRWVQLQAYGQNARFLHNQKITSNTLWNNQLPYVILGGLTVDTFTTLTIPRGTRIYCNANSPIIVDGTLKVNGEKDSVNRVYFRGDRLDPDYRDLPGGWPGIIFRSTSRENALNFAVVKNAYQGVVSLNGASNTIPKLTLNECIIDNAYDIGLLGFNTSITSRNCLISNCGNDAALGQGGSNLLILGGGNYVFNNATLATFGNAYNVHKNPVVYITDAAGSSQAALNVVFRNSIIYGEGGLAEDEIVTNKVGTAFSLRLDSVLYKVKANDPANTVITNSLKNQNPVFDTINTSRRSFDFHLRAGSPCINAGGSTAPNPVDLDGRTRLVATKLDLGCYEKQP